MEKREMLEAVEEIANLVEELPEQHNQYKMETFKILLQRKLGMTPAVTAVIKHQEFTEAAEEELTFGEYYAKLVPEPKSNPKRFAAVADYYERWRREKSITRDEIIDAMTDAGLDKPRNYYRDMIKATTGRKPLLREAETKNELPAWQLTKTGREFMKGIYKEQV